MSTAVWPSLEPQELQVRLESSLANELVWLLSSIQETLSSLKAGLEECASLLAPSDPGSTLVVSSHRSENLKGFLTRTGTRVVKGEIKLRLATLPPPRGLQSFPLVISNDAQAPALVLEQLTSVRALLNACLDVVDASSWAGDPMDASFLAGQLRLLDVNIQEARNALKGGSETETVPWWHNPNDEKMFDPPLPPMLSFHLSILDAALLLEVRVLEPVTSSSAASESPFGLGAPFNIRDRLAVALGAARSPSHDEVGQIFTFKGQEVRVREKVRVESQDPSLMAAMAKLVALERTLALARQALEVVMGGD